MLRAWAPNVEDGATRILLDADEAHHLGRVRRARPGEAVEVLDGCGRLATGTWAGMEGRQCVVDVTGIRDWPRPQPRVWLAVAPPKGGAWGTILEQAVELGVARITPLLTERTELRLEGAARRERWRDKARAILREAAKQSGNPWLPELDAETPWLDWLRAEAPGWLRLRAGLEADARDLAEALRQAGPGTAGIAVAIGPEGDFTAAEAAHARDAGVLPISLGPWVLRTETAALTAVSRLREVR